MGDDQLSHSVGGRPPRKKEKNTTLACRLTPENYALACAFFFSPRSSSRFVGRRKKKERRKSFPGENQIFPRIVISWSVIGRRHRQRPASQPLTRKVLERSRRCFCFPSTRRRVRARRNTLTYSRVTVKLMCAASRHGSPARLLLPHREKKKKTE